MKRWSLEGVVYIYTKRMLDCWNVSTSLEKPGVPLDRGCSRIGGVRESEFEMGREERRITRPRPEEGGVHIGTCIDVGPGRRCKWSSVFTGVEANMVQFVVKGGDAVTGSS